MSNKLYVLAGTMSQAEEFAATLGVPHSDIVHVMGSEKLYGIDGSGKTLYVYGSASHRYNYHDILDAADIRKWEIKYV